MKNWIYFLVIIFLSFSCSSGSDDPDVPGGGDVTVEIVASDNSPVLWQQVGFYIKNTGTSFNEILWDFGDGVTASGMSVNHGYKIEDTYKITVKATTTGGKVAEHEISLTVAGRSLSKALKFFDRSRTWLCAHRCNSGNTAIPENSITALKECIRLGYIDIVEIDTRQTSDGVLVIMHDETVNRTTNGTGKVSEMTYAQIRSLRLKLPDGTITNETVPTLKDFLQESKGKVFIDLDFINKTPHLELYNLVKESGMLDEVLFYTSNDNQAINSLLGYSPAGIVFTQTSKESEAVTYNGKGIYVTQISTAKIQGTNLGLVAAQNSLVVLSNTLVQNGITIDNDMKYNNDYSGLDNLLNKGVNIIQTDQIQLVDKYLKSKNKR